MVQNFENKFFSTVGWNIYSCWFCSIRLRIFRIMKTCLICTTSVIIYVIKIFHRVVPVFKWLHLFQVRLSAVYLRLPFNIEVLRRIFVCMSVDTESYINSFHYTAVSSWLTLRGRGLVLHSNFYIVICSWLSNY